jgi:ribonucleoside-diphosphate reductase subunit M1
MRKIENSDHFQARLRFRNDIMLQIRRRSGISEDVRFDRITDYLAALSREGLHGPALPNADTTLVAQKVVAGIVSGMTTSDLDDLAAETSVAMQTVHPDYGTLAGRIAVAALHKDTQPSFAESMRLLAAAGIVPHGTTPARIEAAIDHSRDFGYSYFGIKTLMKSYLLRVNGTIVERPQHMLMRVATGIWGDDVPEAINQYEYMSKGMYTHASPSLFNIGTLRPQGSSCFLLTMKEDSVKGIFDTVSECASISKWAGGVGISISGVRAKGSYIRGTNSTGSGVVPMLRVFNDVARYIDQGGGRRKGAFAAYLEPWHADVLDFIDLRRTTGAEESRARDLFLGLWVPDLFMRRVQNGEPWSLFCPDECPGLQDAWGAEFDALYHRYEAGGKARRTLPARDIMNAIIDSQMEGGQPYFMFKDAVNAKSNHKHLGTIRGSNLCTEICQYTSPDETAVCNLASIALPSCIYGAPSPGSLEAHTRSFDYQQLISTVRVATRALDRMIDINFYPSEPARTSNMLHRPIGLGVSGLADVFALLGLPFDSPGARELNATIFEAIYFAALTESCELAHKYGAYETHAGSPASLGILQPDLWPGTEPSGRFNWDELRANIGRFGLRNSLLTAPMPTASTAQIMGHNECFEPFGGNLYVRRVLSGEFTVANKHLMADLHALNLWSPAMKNALLANDGSVQKLPIPDHLKKLYRTVWEIPQSSIIDMAADRGPYVDQSQSMNIHMQEPTRNKVLGMHFKAWKAGLKSSLYYLRTQAVAQPVKFAIGVPAPGAQPPACTDDVCHMCSA